MSLSDQQADFSKKLVELLCWAYQTKPNIKLVLTWGERDFETQQRLVQAKKSWTLNSLHLKKLAHDLILFDGPTPLYAYEDYLWLGEKAEELGLKWGGRWKQRDACHFEYGF